MTQQFRQCRDKLKVAWEYGHIKVRVTRGTILHDSLKNFQRAKKEDMHKIFRFQFTGEEGIDAGGLAREWFQVVSEQLFNPDFGLFIGSGVGGEIVTINPQSGIANEHHLEYFKFGKERKKEKFKKKFKNKKKQKQKQISTSNLTHFFCFIVSFLSLVLFFFFFI